MQPVKEHNPIHLFLKHYFTGLYRWSEVVRISFPKLDKHALGKNQGTQPMRIIVTGIPGSVIMSWSDAGLFYTPEAPPPPSGKSEPRWHPFRGKPSPSKCR